MHRILLTLLAALVLAAASGLSSAQDPPTKQPRGVPQDAVQAPVERQVSDRNYVVEALVVGFLVVGAVFAVGRTSRRA